MKRKIKLGKLIPLIVLCSFIVPTIFLIIELVMYEENRAETAFKLMECVIGLFLFFIPNVLEKKLKVEFHPVIYFSYILFLYCTVFLGEFQNFYYIIPNWDTYLHLFSASMFGILGFSIVFLMNNRSAKIVLSPFFIAVFAFAFAISIGAVWEIFEYIIDISFKTNMQKYILESGEVLVGNLALQDTMEDLIIDFCGALIGAIIGYVSLIKQSKWVDSLLKIKKKEVETNECKNN